MDSLKIVLLADTHFGYSMGTAQAKRIVKKINTENPDVVCIAGDIFDNEYDAISKPDKLKEILKGIKSKLWSLCLLGQSRPERTNSGRFHLQRNRR